MRRGTMIEYQMFHLDRQQNLNYNIINKKLNYTTLISNFKKSITTFVIDFSLNT